MKSFVIKGLLLFLLSLVVNGLLLFVLAAPFNWLWNATLAAIFSAPQLNYHQSAELLGLIFIVRWVVTGVTFYVNQRD